MLFSSHIHVHAHTHDIYAMIISTLWHFRGGTTYFKCDSKEFMLKLITYIDIEYNLDIKPPRFSGLYHIGLHIRKAFDK